MTKKRIFYPGKYYVATAENECYAFETYADAKKFVLEPTDTILLALSNKDKDKEPYKTDLISYKPNITDAITIDFDKKSLTVEGDDVRIFTKTFSKGTTKLEKEDLKLWDTLVKECKRCSKSFKIIGTPPLLDNEKDLDNEMSDL